MKILWAKEKLKAFLNRSKSTNTSKDRESKQPTGDRLLYRTAMQKAANDPDFRRDVENTMRDFVHT